MKKQDVHKIVREGYAQVALQSGSCCGNGKGASTVGCGCGSSIISAESISKNIGYSDPTAKVIIDDLKITSEQIKDTENSIASIKVSGIKPL